ncbi:MAG: hypothetical protein JWM80_1754 [Cyanobacteria bacterium RYN_339]|nr:hypothetical protein [Cyanobacteria bacterium RYN_339]
MADDTELALDLVLDSLKKGVSAMRIVLTPLFFIAIAFAAGAWAGPAAGLDDAHVPTAHELQP